MAGLNAADIVEIKAKGTLLGQSIITTWHYVVVEPSNHPDVMVACQRVADNFSAGVITPFSAFLAVCPQNYVCDEVTAQKVYPDRWRAAHSPLALPGTDPNDTNSSNQAAFVMKATVVAKRGETGGWHIPGLTEPNLVNGKVSNAFLTKLSTFGSRCLNLWNEPTDGALQLKPVMYHRWKGVPFPVKPNLALWTTVPMLTARVMRRRTIGVGK